MPYDIKCLDLAAVRAAADRERLGGGMSAADKKDYYPLDQVIYIREPGKLMAEIDNNGAISTAKLATVRRGEAVYVRLFLRADK